MSWSAHAVCALFLNLYAFAFAYGTSSKRQPCDLVVVVVRHPYLTAVLSPSSRWASLCPPALLPSATLSSPLPCDSAAVRLRVKTIFSYIFQSVSSLCLHSASTGPNLPLR